MCFVRRLGGRLLRRPGRATHSAICHDHSATATRGETRVWQGLGGDPYFYYIHSYFPEPLDSTSVLATTTHGTQSFAGAVERGQMFGCQFHPEKSQEAGLRLIRNFLGL